jgi:hypothetical protein
MAMVVYGIISVKTLRDGAFKHNDCLFEQKRMIKLAQQDAGEIALPER